MQKALFLVLELQRSLPKRTSFFKHAIIEHFVLDTVLGIQKKTKLNLWLQKK